MVVEFPTTAHPLQLCEKLPLGHAAFAEPLIRRKKHPIPSARVESLIISPSVFPQDGENCG